MTVEPLYGVLEKLNPYFFFYIFGKPVKPIDFIPPLTKFKVTLLVETADRRMEKCRGTERV